MVYSVLTPDGNVLFTGLNLQDAVKRCESCKACVRRTRIARVLPDGELVEIGFDLAKEIAEVILKQYTRAGIPIVRK